VNRDQPRIGTQKLGFTPVLNPKIAKKLTKGAWHLWLTF